MSKLGLVGILLASLLVGLACAIYIPLFDLHRRLNRRRVYLACNFDDRANLIFE